VTKQHHLNLHDPKTRQKVLVGAGVAAALVAFLYVRKNGSTSTTTGGTPTDPTIDPITGIPYALEAGAYGAGVSAAGTTSPTPKPKKPKKPKKKPKPKVHHRPKRKPTARHHPKPKPKPPVHHHPQPRPRRRTHGHPQHPPGHAGGAPAGTGAWRAQ
jgi:outer membrane biosynthesis protein TonB